MSGNPIANVVRGATDVMTFGTAELGWQSKIGQSLLKGGGGGGSGPGGVPTQSPLEMLSQTGGAPLLTTIALGGNVKDAVAGFFGQKGGSYDEWFKSLSPDDQKAIDGVTNSLTQIQGNTDLRNQAVQKVVQDFPNIVSMTAPKVIEAKQRAGEEFDSATKGYLDYALKQVAAKGGANGTVSSGATIQASADAAAKLGEDRLNYTTGEGDKALGLLSTDWQNQYTEANALRNFQQKMLGQGATQGFSAYQSLLDRNLNANTTNTKIANDKAIADQASQDALLGAIGKLGGTALGYYIGGPVGDTARAIPSSNDASAGYRS